MQVIKQNRIMRIHNKLIISSLLFGSAIVLVEIVLFPFRLLSLPIEWLSSFRLADASGEAVISIPPSYGSSHLIPIIIIGLIGLVMLLLLASGSLFWLGGSFTRRIHISLIALLVSFYLINPLYNYIFGLITTREFQSNLTFPSNFIINLHFITLLIIFAQKKLTHNWKYLVSGYLLVMVVAYIVIQIISSQDIDRLWVSFILTPIAWANINTFSFIGIQKTGTTILDIVGILGLNIVVILMSLFI